MSTASSLARACGLACAFVGAVASTQLHATDAQYLRRGPKVPITKTEIVNLGPGCRVRVKVPDYTSIKSRYFTAASDGYTELQISKVRYFTEVDLHLQFKCIASSHRDVVESTAIPDGDGAEWRVAMDAEEIERFLAVDALSIQSVRGIDTTGWIVRVDEIIGDERFRVRRFDYCLIKREKAVCGTAEVPNGKDGPQDKEPDLATVALNIIRSIEFLPDAPPVPSDNQ